MTRKMKILILEDSKTDIDLICWEIESGNILYHKLVVDNKEDYITALNDFHPDLILSDHSLPQFNSLEALDILLAKGSKIPFILVTGTMSEDFAVKVMKNGAWDYVSKNQLNLLPEAITKAMQKYHLEKGRRTFLYEAILTEAYMQEAESIAHYGSWQLDMINNKLKLSKEAYNILGYFAGETEISYEKIFTRIHPDEVDKIKRLINDIVTNPNHDVYQDSFRLINSDGEYRVIKVEFVLKHNLGHKLLRVNGVVQDVTASVKTEEHLQVSETNSLKQEEVKTEDAIIFLNSSGYILGSNIEAQNMLGYSKDEMINKPISIIYEDKQMQHEDFFRYRKNIKGEVRFKNKSFYLKKNGSRVLTDVVVTILVDHEDKLSGFMLVLREINVNARHLLLNN